MASTFSPALRIELIGDGDRAGTWGQATNLNLGTILESAVAGYTAVTTSTAQQALTVANGAADQARSAMLALNTSTGADFQVFAPPSAKSYVVVNLSATYTATVYNSTSIGNTTAAGTGVAIPPGARYLIVSDGVDFVLVGEVSASSNTPDTLVRRDGSGNFAAGTITADLVGDVTGNLLGDVTGNLLGDVTGNLLGDVTGDVSGNAGAVTNGVYTVGDQTISGVKTFSSPIVAENAVPPGAVMQFARNTPPAGWLKANGAAVSRTTYAALFASISTTFGSGDGSTTFNVPDLRGEFIRGWDDGRGVDTGRVFGSAQAQAIQAHTHTTAFNRYNDGNSQQISALSATGTVFQGTVDMPSSSTGGAETRPRSIALLYCIKT